MIRVVLARLLALIPLLFIASIVAFALIQLAPTDPAVVRLGENASDEAYAAYRAEIGVDRPVVVQYGDWLAGAVHGDFGTSWQDSSSVSDLLETRLPITISLTIGALAAEVGWSRQHLGRRFTDEFGLSPKSAARVMRFDRARHALAARPTTTSIAEVAAACGYYDQAHLNREFAELARCTPTELLAGDLPSDEHLPSVQDRSESVGAH